MTLFSQMQNADLPADDGQHLRPASIDGLQDRVAMLERDDFRAGNLQRRVVALERIVKAQIRAIRHLERNVAALIAMVADQEIG